MRFQAPLAWLGLAAIAIPILIHLLGRRPARRLPFPTLRFVDATRQTPVRRHRLMDLVLLALRIGIVAAAVVALTQPLFLTGARSRDLARQLTRAIVVDTSASMDRVGPDGTPALDRARREAEPLRAEATSVRVVESTAPAGALPGVLAWLATQSGKREIVVVSDFQGHAIERADFAGVPEDVGIRLIAVDAGTLPTRAGDTTTIDILTSAADRSKAEATVRAAHTSGAPAAIRADRPIAIVFPQNPERASWQKDSRAIDQPWMFDVARAISADRGVVDTSATAAFRADGRQRLLVFIDADSGTLASAALITAVARAADPAPPASEQDSTITTATELRSWERPPADVRPSPTGDGASDGRWFWVAALVLLVVETLVRRRRPAAAPEVAHARVA